MPGPECFTGDGDGVDQEVISWRGKIYSLRERSAKLVREWMPPVLPEKWARDCGKRFGVVGL